MFDIYSKSEMHGIYDSDIFKVCKVKLYTVNQYCMVHMSDILRVQILINTVI